jgi:hypothetical protein
MLGAGGTAVPEERKHYPLITGRRPVCNIVQEVQPPARSRTSSYFGSAKAMISSFVTSDRVSPPPVLMIVTYCRPSDPM